MFNKEIFNEVIDKIEERMYFSDLPEIKVGDVVTVDGKMENQIAVVTKVLSSFKKPKFDMKWIVSIINNDITGVYFKIENDVVSLSSNLTVDKFMNIYAGAKYKENNAIGEDDIELNLETLEESELFEDEFVKERGRLLYKNNAVQYIYLKDGVGKAVVRSANGNDWYEIDFRCRKGRITYLACDCPYFGACKHLYAFLLKLRDFSKKFYKQYNEDSFVMCSKGCFNYIMLYGKGRVTIEL